MANNIEFVVLGDVKDLEKKLSGVKKGFDTLSKNAGIALAGLTASAYGFIEAAREQEQAINQLNQALQNQGNYSEAVSKDLQKYASALQEVSLFGDETIIKAQALIASFGFEGQTLKDLTKATLDLAQAKGIDLTSAADLVAKSVGGTANILGRYGIEVEGAAGSTERASAAIAGITKLYGGQAEAATKGLGQTIVLKNAMSDLAETMGDALAPTILEVTKGIKGFVDYVKANPEVTNLAAKMLILGVQISTVALALGLLGKAFIATRVVALALSEAMFVLNGRVILLSEVLGPLAGIGFAAFAGWQLGRWIGEVTGLNEALSGTEGILTRIFKANSIAKVEADTAAALAARGQTPEQIKADAALRLKNLQEEKKAFAQAEEEKSTIRKQVIEDQTNIDAQLRQISQARTQTELDDLLVKFEQEREALQEHIDIKLEMMRNNGISEGQEYQALIDEKNRIDNEYAAISILGEQQRTDKITEFEQKVRDNVAKINKDKVGSLRDTLQQAAQLNSKFALAYKAVAIGEAIMSTSAGVARALKDYPFPVNIAVGALIGAAGAVQISSIAAQQFAVGTPEVPKDMIAKVHKKETIVPATFSEGIRRGDLTLSGPKSSGGGGGGGVNFDFSGAVFNGITDTLVKDIFTKASENIKQGTLVALPA